MRRFAALAAAAAITAAGALLGVAPVAQAGGPECKPTWVIGVGGAQITWAIPPHTGQDSSYMIGDALVGYNSIHIDEGVAELDRLFWQYRAACPGSHIKLMGHSAGAAVIHVWVSNHQQVPNASAVLFADPKRAAGPGGPGIAALRLRLPAELLGLFRGVGGADANFGAFPVLSICNAGDWVCNKDANMVGYLFTGVHVRYNPDPSLYPDNSRGVWYLNEY